MRTEQTIELKNDVSFYLIDTKCTVKAGTKITLDMEHMVAFSAEHDSWFGVEPWDFVGKDDSGAVIPDTEFASSEQRLFQYCDWQARVCPALDAIDALKNSRALFDDDFFLALIDAGYVVYSDDEDSLELFLTDLGRKCLEGYRRSEESERYIAEWKAARLAMLS